MKKVIRSSKNFVLNHKTLIAVVCVTTVVIVKQADQLKELNGFLEAKNLVTEFYGADAF